MSDKETKNDGAFKNRDVQIERAGTKIVLPNEPREMTHDEAIDNLMRIKKQESVLVAVNEEVDAFPLEGAWALTRVLQEMFGYILQETGESFFGKFPTSMYVSLDVAHEKKEQVIWGQIGVPGVDGHLQTGVSRTPEGQLKFAIKGEIKKAGQHIVKKIADRVREYVKENSLYRGKAIKLKTHVNPDSGRLEVDLTSPPSFLDLSKVHEDQLTFSDDVQELVNTNLFTPIEKTEICRKAGVPMKRAVLLEGPYGTGKTLTAFVSAKKAQENGWTFIYLDRVQGLKETMIFARRYQPCVIFTEDIERVVSGGRSTDVDDILNNIDGIDSKNQEVLCIFTTNHVEKINKAMLRAGRLDAVITVAPPDQKAAEKLIRLYSKDLLDTKEDISKASKELSGQIPAFIREATERAKLYAISKAKSADTLSIKGEDVRLAAVGMKNHLALAAENKERPLSTAERLERALAEIFLRAYDDGYPTNNNEMMHVTGSNETEALKQLNESLN